MSIDRRSFIATTATSIGVIGAGGCSALGGTSAQTLEGRVIRDESFPKLPIGMNLSPISDWGTGFPFRNLFMGARPWITRNNNYSGPHDTKSHDAFQFDLDGYPLQVPVMAPGNNVPQYLFTYIPSTLDPGDYVLLYDGDGEIDTLGPSQIISRKKGRLELQMIHDSKRLESLVIKKSTRGNHIRNIRIVSKADEKADLNSAPFSQVFLDFCRQFHCLRFMDWGAINGSIEEEWANRKRPSFYTQVGKSGDPDALYGPAPSSFERRYSGGVAIEYMIQLCNELKIDPWFCMPHRATDDYIRQFARLVKDQLDPNLKVYVEYSNEVWNWGFRQAGWMIRSELAGSIVEAKGGKAWTGTDKKKGDNHPERIAALFRRTFSIWERVWEGTDQKRLVRVCSVQGAWPDASKRTIKWCMENGGADAVSPAAYVGPDKEVYERWAVAGPNLTPKQVIADLMSGKDIAREGNSVASIVRYAASLGLTFVAYEGGQHIQPRGQVDQPYSAALAAAQYHPAMYDLYVELLRYHRDVGCELFCHFNSVSTQGTRFGSWGAKGSYAEADNSSPKMRALVNCNVSKKLLTS
jgi:hypothetical protein